MELNNAFSVEIPNDILVVPPQEVTETGAISTDTARSEVLLDPTLAVNADDAAILGRPFFSAAYLYLDHDAGTFTLWQANPTTETDLVVLGGGCSDLQVNAPGNNGSAIGSHNDGASASNHTMPGKKKPGTAHNSHLPTGVVVGAVVGSAVGAAALAAIVVVVYMRKRGDRRPLAKHEDIAISEPQSQPHVQNGSSQMYDNRPLGQGVGFNEAMSSEFREMGAHQDPFEIAGREKPAELQAALRSKWRRGPFLAANESPVELG